MKGIVKRNGVSNGRKVVGSSQSASERPANLKVVHTLEEYKEGLDESNGKIVVVRFFATWCKVRMRQVLQTVFSVLYFHSSYCHSTLYIHLYPSFRLQACKAIQPVTNDNVNLHQGLEVPSLPYGHIYYPDAGLVEEMKISKKYFPRLVKKVRWYDEGLCGIDEFVPEESDDADEEN
jgi:hypothetical protein